MTTTLISSEFGSRPGYVAVSACPATAGTPRVRRQPVIDAMWLGLVADKPIFHKSTRVSVPGCRGTT